MCPLMKYQNEYYGSNQALIVFKTCSTRWNPYLTLFLSRPQTDSIAKHVICPQKEHTTLLLLKDIVLTDSE